MTYKETLKKIESIVQKLESGELEMDEMTNHIKEALTLIDSCREKLRSTEKDIEKSFDSDQETDQVK